MSIKKDIEILINSISSIEDRHLLELIAVYDGLKDVMRIHINFHNEYLSPSIPLIKSNPRTGTFKILSLSMK